MNTILELSSEVGRSLRQATRELGWKLAPAALAGVFLAELFVMRVLRRLEFLERGLASDLVDSFLVALLILPGLYLLVVRPVGRLSARLATASADARFRTVVEAAGDGIMVIGSDGRVRYANPAAERLFRYAAGELKGLHLSTLLEEPSGEVSTRRDGPPAFETATLESRRLEGRTRDESRFPVELTSRSLSVTGTGGSVCVVRDMRQKKRLGLYEVLLPVCSVCGNIRDDVGREHGSGSWTSLETYVQKHAAAQFSHSFCPECLVEYRRQQGLKPVA